MTSRKCGRIIWVPIPIQKVQTSSLFEVEFEMNWAITSSFERDTNALKMNEYGK